MSYLHDLFNVTNDFELNKILESLDLTYNDMLMIEHISKCKCRIKERRRELLEYLAGTADGNYEKVYDQLNKVYKQRVLKEDSGLNLNQVMELNQLVELVAAKLSANQEQCMQGVFNIISKKAGKNIANTFIGMVQQSAVNQSSLKFNTDLVVDGKNLAQTIYALKNEIEMFCNSVKKEETEKEEVKESVDGYSVENRLAGVYNIKNGSFRELASGEQHNLSEQDFKNRLVRYGFQDTEDGKVCYITSWSYADAFNTRRALTKKYPNENVEKWRLEWFQNGDGSWNRPLKKYVEIIGKDGQKLTESYESYKHIIDELDRAVDDVTDINVLRSIADRVNNLLARVKNMNEANDIATLKTAIETKMNTLLDVKPQLEESCLASQVVANTCEEDTFNGLLDGIKPTIINITVNKEGNGILSCAEESPCEEECAAPIVQPMELSPTAIDAPILRKPNSAEVTSAITALSSHANDIKSDSRENNIENLQTINTLLSQISNYFNQMLGESVEYTSIIKEDNEHDEFRELSDDDYIYSNDNYEDIDLQNIADSIIKVKVTNIIIDIDIGDGDNEEFYDKVYEFIIHHDSDSDIYEEVTEEIENKLGFCVYDYSMKILNIDYDYDKKSDKVRLQKADFKYKIGTILKDRDLKDVFYTIKEQNVKYLEGRGKTNVYGIVDNKHPQIKRWVSEDKIEVFYELVDDDVEWDGEELDETCSAGATCAASVTSVPSKPRKQKVKTRKPESVDLSLFKEAIQNDIPVSLSINGKNVQYKLVEGKGYLYIDNGIVKTLDKNVMLETIDDVYNNCLETEVLEGFNAYELNILLEDEMNPELGDVNTTTTITPEEKKHQQDELDKKLNQNPNTKVGIVTGNNDNSMKQNQEFVGFDDSDPNNKKYIVKDPATGDMKVVGYNQIKLTEM